MKGARPRGERLFRPTSGPCETISKSWPLGVAVLSLQDGSLQLGRLPEFRVHGFPPHELHTFSVLVMSLEDLTRSKGES